MLERGYDTNSLSWVELELIQRDDNFIYEVMKLRGSPIEDRNYKLLSFKERVKTSVENKSV